MNDSYDLDRFVTAQDDADTYRHALRELTDGRKRTHWMWFVFPQIAGLGQSPVSRHYAIALLDEAHAYLAHPIMGARPVDSARAVLDIEDRTAEQIFGTIDAQSSDRR